MPPWTEIFNVVGGTRVSVARAGTRGSAPWYMSFSALCFFYCLDAEALVASQNGGCFAYLHRFLLLGLTRVAQIQGSRFERRHRQQAADCDSTEPRSTLLNFRDSVRAS